MTTAPTLKAMHPVSADLSCLPLPGFAQEKHDGVGGLVDPLAGLVSKTGQPIANKDARQLLSIPALWGLHGELTAPGGFEEAQSVFAASSGLPSGWRFMVFDHAGSSAAFVDRLAMARRKVESLGAQDVVQIVPARKVTTLAAVRDALEEVISRNGEGLVLKCGPWGYREGKASSTRGEAVKVKPTDELEASILEVRARADDPEAAGSVLLDLGGQAFAAPVALSRAQAMRLMTQRASLPGRAGTIRFSGFTERGVPRCARFIGVRRDLAA
ncbi:hypothetical protein V7S57_02565 [Caulobacter sp. CCNWLY153]|uniref:hypothetical protein n=1 Tax=unclassified Caulobacter TaxID=2648921 RepID=UPI002FF0C7E9